MSAASLRFRSILPCLLALVTCGCLAAGEGPPTASEAESFLAEAERILLERSNDEARHGWVQATFITEDTDVLYAQANERYIAAAVDLAKRATRFAGLELPEEQRRKLERLRLALSLPAPEDGELRGELTRIAAGMESAYGRGEYCPEDGECRDLGELSRVMASSRDPRELAEVWAGWRTIARPLRSEYERFAELGNQGARELGFDDLGAMWRVQVRLPPDEFTAETERLWQQVRPLYEQLHCYVRGRLGEHYGEETVPQDGPIPAHLLGNMWAQSWGNIYDLVALPGDVPGRRPDRPARAGRGRLARHGALRRGVLHLPRLPAAARDVLAALAVRPAAGPRSGLSRQRLEHRLRGRHPHQDVHRDHRRGLQRRPPRAGAQHLPAGLQQAAGAVSRSAPTAASTRRWATRWPCR